MSCLPGTPRPFSNRCWPIIFTWLLASLPYPVVNPLLGKILSVQSTWRPSKRSLTDPHWDWSLACFKCRQTHVPCIQLSPCRKLFQWNRWLEAFQPAFPMEKSGKVIASCRNKGVSSLHKPLSLFFIQNALEVMLLCPVIGWGAWISKSWDANKGPPWDCEQQEANLPGRMGPVLLPSLVQLPQPEQRRRTP